MSALSSINELGLPVVAQSAGTVDVSSDHGLLAAVRAGDEAAFAELVRRYRNQITNYVYRMTNDYELAVDLAQETFLRVYRAADRYQTGYSFSTYIYRIATNLCMDQLRRRKLIRWEPWETFVSLFHPTQVARDNPERDALRHESRELVHEVLQELPPRYRICLVLREYHGMSCEEIGDVIGSSRSAVKSLLFRAREEFRQVYQRLGGTDPL